MSVEMKSNSLTLKLFQLNQTCILQMLVSWMTTKLIGDLMRILVNDQESCGRTSGACPDESNRSHLSDA